MELAADGRVGTFRELTELEVREIAGGDLGDFAAWGAGVGGLFGAVAGYTYMGGSSLGLAAYGAMGFGALGGALGVSFGIGWAIGTQINHLINKAI
jgi:hypothetical protein